VTIRMADSEATPVPTLNFPLDDVLHRRAKSAAALRGISLKTYVTEAIAAAVERDGYKARTTRKGR